MNTIKQDALLAISELPPNANWEDVVHKIGLLQLEPNHVDRNENYDPILPENMRRDPDSW